MGGSRTNGDAFKSGVIRPVVSREYVSLPNSILADRRLSLDTRGMICFLLSKSRGWEVRPQALAKQLSREDVPLGRRKLDRMFQEAMAAGYMIRSQKQAHKDDGSFGRYAYLVGMPEDLKSELRGIDVALLPHARLAQAQDAHTRDAHAQNAHAQIHQIKTSQRTESKKHLHHQSGHPPSNTTAEAKLATENSYSALGVSAQSTGMIFVWAGSDPFKVWRAFRGDEGMPLIDVAIIDGKERRGCWFQSLYPPTRKPAVSRKTATDENEPATSKFANEPFVLARQRCVMLEPGSAEWNAERARMIAAGESTKFMDSQAADGIGWSVQR